MLCTTNTPLIPTYEYMYKPRCTQPIGTEYIMCVCVCVCVCVCDGGGGGIGRVGISMGNIYDNN